MLNSLYIKNFRLFQELQIERLGRINYQSDGMLEDLIKQTVYGDQQLTLLQTATTCLEQLPVTLFQPHHHTKATIYSWLAWQTRPGQALVSTINADLINLHSQEMQAFIKWRRDLF